MREIRENFEVAVIGGGMAGICAAVASARSGARTALVQDRPVLGGNASSEIRVHINGAQAMTGPHWTERETGIIEEVLLENRARNPQESWPVWSHILHDFVTRQEGLSLFLNTHACEAETDGERITAARCHQASGSASRGRSSSPNDHRSTTRSKRPARTKPNTNGTRRAGSTPTSSGCFPRRRNTAKPPSASRTT